MLCVVLNPPRPVCRRRRHRRRISFDLPSSTERGGPRSTDGRRRHNMKMGFFFFFFLSQTLSLSFFFLYLFFFLALPENKDDIRGNLPIETLRARGTYVLDKMVRKPTTWHIFYLVPLESLALSNAWRQRLPRSSSSSLLYCHWRRQSPNAPISDDNNNTRKGEKRDLDIYYRDVNASAAAAGSHSRRKRISNRSNNDSRWDCQNSKNGGINVRPTTATTWATKVKERSGCDETQQHQVMIQIGLREKNREMNIFFSSSFFFKLQLTRKREKEKNNLKVRN